MKYKFLSLCAMTLSLLTTSCDAFLETAPDDRMKINTLIKAEQTVAGAYNSSNTRFTDFCTDNVGLVKGCNDLEPIINDLYQWKRSFVDDEHQDAPGAFWRNAYNAIAGANLALESLVGIQTTSDEEALFAMGIRAEALAIRSYYHFQLVNLFAPHYKNETASSTLGVPYVTKLEDQLIVHYDRASVEETYQLAEQDLQEALDLMNTPGVKMSTNKYRFTRATILAYAARFYTYRNKDQADVEKALDFAERAIDEYGGLSKMRPWSDYMNDFNGPVDVKQGEVGMVDGCATWTAYNFTYHMTIPIKNNQLKAPFSGFQDNRTAMSYQAEGDIFLPAFYFVVGSDGRTTYIDQFPLAEQVMLAAEAHTRLKQYDQALDYMITLASRNYQTYDPTMITLENLRQIYFTQDGDKDQHALISYILHERRVQFLMKGFRWFDIRRYEMEVEHPLVDGSIIYLSDFAPRRDFQLPKYAIAAGITPNPNF